MDLFARAGPCFTFSSPVIATLDVDDVSPNTNILLMKNTKTARKLFANVTVKLPNASEKHTTTNHILSMTPRNASQSKCADFVK